MQKILLPVLLSLCAMLYSVQAHAYVPENTLIDSRTIKPLMEWVERKIKVKVPVYPTVVASRERLDKEVDNASKICIGHPLSVYVPGTVILDHITWASDDPIQVSILVHELVHHAQFYMKKNWKAGERERQAYRLQNRWLVEHNLTPFFTTAWINRASGLLPAD